MKKNLIILIVTIFLIISFCGCTSSNNDQINNYDDTQDSDGDGYDDDEDDFPNDSNLHERRIIVENYQKHTLNPGQNYYKDLNVNYMKYLIVELSVVSGENVHFDIQRYHGSGSDFISEDILEVVDQSVNEKFYITSQMREESWNYNIVARNEGTSSCTVDMLIEAWS